MVREEPACEAQKYRDCKKCLRLSFNESLIKYFISQNKRFEYIVEVFGNKEGKLCRLQCALGQD